MLNVETNTVISIKVNDTFIVVNKNTTIIQACLKYNIDIPRFCFHDKLKIAGNCRMCLVEVVKSPKPVAACAMQVMPDMIIKTNTALVKKAREGVIEFLLVNHPLDCPICDQGGECDLQDQAMIFGGDKGRFYEFKRSVENKNCGPFVKMLMTRCIHCTRCIRFLTDIAGISTLGLVGRGNNVSISTYLDKVIHSEVLGNIIDLCPVGALTSKPYAFNARSWELTNIETVDIFDSLSADIRIDIRGTDILRILPRFNHLVNSNWLTDVSRFSFDGLRLQRISEPYYKVSNKLVATNWDFIFDYFLKYKYINRYILLKNSSYSFRGGSFSDAKSLIILKDLANYLGSSDYSIESDLNTINCDFKNNYILPIHKEKLINYQICVLIGINLRLESPLYNLVLRRLYLKKQLLIILFTNSVNLTYYTLHVGLGLQNFIKFLEGKHLICNLVNLINNKVFFIFGSGFVVRGDFNNFINSLLIFKSKFKFLNFDFGVLMSKLSVITSYELGIVPGLNYYNNISYSTIFDKNSLYTKSVNYLFTLENNSFLFKDNYNQFHISLNYLYDNTSLSKGDIILPIATFYEKQGYFINIENMLRFSNNVFVPKGLIKEDVRILLAIYYSFNKLNNLFNFNLDFKYLKFIKYFKNICKLVFKKSNQCLFNFNLYFIFNIMLINNYFILNKWFFIINKFIIFFNCNNLNKNNLIFYLNYFVKYFIFEASINISLFNINNLDKYIVLKLKNISYIFNVNYLFNLSYILFNPLGLSNSYITYVTILYNYPFISNIDNYFTTNNISMNSSVMLDASQKFKFIFTNYL